MKFKLSFFLSISILLLSAIVVMGEETETRYVQPEKENLRATPNGKKIGELLQGSELIVEEKQGKWLKVRVIGWIYEPSTTSTRDTIQQTGSDRNVLVEFVNSRVKSLPADYGRDSKPYGAHIRGYFQFKNNSKKTLTGLIYETTFLDSFGDVLYKTTMKDQLKVTPGQRNRMDTFWYWEDNEFIDGEPYDKLQPAAGAGTIKIKIKLKKAVFQDGTVINF